MNELKEVAHFQEFLRVFGVCAQGIRGESGFFLRFGSVTSSTIERLRRTRGGKGV